VRFVVFSDETGNVQMFNGFWLHHVSDGTITIRWRMSYADLEVCEITRVALVDVDGNEIAQATPPSVAAALNVVYEGYWIFS
jgi:hypothetical protein